MDITKCSACGKTHLDVLAEDNYFICPITSVKVFYRDKEQYSSRCVWMENPEAYAWETSCLNSFDSDSEIPSSFKYCPYCGKEIKLMACD